MLQDNSWQQLRQILHYLCEAWEGGEHTPRHCSNHDDHLSHGNSIFSLHPATIGLLLSYDKGDGIGDKIPLGGRYGTSA